MSKKEFKKVTKLNRVVAIPGQKIKNPNGEVVKQLYRITKLG